jgi:transposase-like protein
MNTADLENPIFTDETAAREHLERVLWPNGPVCPHCGERERLTKLQGKSHRPGLYHCKAKGCGKQFTVTVGTLYERSHIPLHKWVLATHLMNASKKGISAHQLHRMLGLSYKSAWFMAHRIRAGMVDAADDPEGLGGEGKTVEADETLYLTAVSGRSRGMRPGQPERDVRPRVCDVDGALGLATAPSPRSDGIEGHSSGMSLHRQGGSAHGGASRRGERHGVARHRCVEGQAGLRAPGR